MSLKSYQPERKDLLINTNWGIPQERLSDEAAKARGLRLLQGRWISKEDERQLKDEAHAYRAIRVLAGLLQFFGFFALFWTVLAVRSGGSQWLFVLLPSAAYLAAGIGLRRYALWARNLAAVLFGLMCVLPFVPIGSDDKGGPFFLVIGGLGLYYLFRKTAAKIFNGGQ